MNKKEEETLIRWKSDVEEFLTQVAGLLKLPPPGTEKCGYCKEYLYPEEFTDIMVAGSSFRLCESCNAEWREKLMASYTDFAKEKVERSKEPDDPIST